MRQTHPNSVTALRSFDKDTRYTMILDLLHKEGVPMTDRGIAYALGFSECNATRPRITELLHDGILEEAGDTIDHMTGVRVRTVKIRQQQLSFAALSV